MNPYDMWTDQTPRQVYELLKTYKDLHKESTKSAKSNITNNDQNTDYKVVGKVKIPSWLKIPKGATIYNADDVTQEQMML